MIIIDVIVRSICKCYHLILDFDVSLTAALG